MNIKCIVIDDEQPARDLLVSYIEKLPHLELIAVHKNPFEALKILNREHIDLLFLDIQMPELKGTELLQSIKHRPVVIFTTAYQEYAIEGYELDVIDYLLKPISFERFLKGVNKAGDQINLLRENKSVIFTKTEESRPDACVFIKAGKGLYRILLDDILYIEGLKEYVSFYTREKRVVTYETLQKLEQSLPAQFIRIHKSYIVNRNKISLLINNEVEVEGKHLPVGMKYKEDVKIEALEQDPYVGRGAYKM